MGALKDRGGFPCTAKEWLNLLFMKKRFTESGRLGERSIQ